MNAIDMFELIDYEYEDGEHCDYYINDKKGFTIEIRQYINEYVKYETKTKKRRGIDAKEHQAITQALIEFGYIKDEELDKLTKIKKIVFDNNLGHIELYIELQELLKE